MATLLMCTTSSSLGQTANRQSVPSRYVDIASRQRVVACQIAGDVNYWHYHCVVNWVVTKQYNRKQRILIFWRLSHLNKVQKLGSCWDDRPCQSNVGWKVGEAAVPLCKGGAGSPSNTMWPWPRLTSVSSGILIHPTVWSKDTNVTEIQTDRTGQGMTTVR